MLKLSTAIIKAQPPLVTDYIPDLERTNFHHFSGEGKPLLYSFPEKINFERMKILLRLT